MGTNVSHYESMWPVPLLWLKEFAEKNKHNKQVLHFLKHSVIFVNYGVNNQNCITHTLNVGGRVAALRFEDHIKFEGISRQCQVCLNYEQAKELHNLNGGFVMTETNCRQIPKDGNFYLSEE